MSRELVVPSLLLSPRASDAPTYELGIAFGPTGCGKTTLAERVARRYTRAGGRAWAIDPSNAWKGNDAGVKPVWPKEGLAELDELLIKMQSWPPGLLILDDADKYMRRPSQVRDDYMTSFRHYRKDLLMISRRPQGIPKDGISNARWIALFPGSTTEPGARRYLADIFPDDIMDRVPSQEWRYLLLYRIGARWAIVRRRVEPRTLRTQSDKT